MNISTATNRSSIRTNVAYESESLEKKLRRTIASGQPIDNVCEVIYTDRKDGVLPQYDIRTDRFEVALNAMDKFTRSAAARREEIIKANEDEPTYVTD